MRGDCTTTSSSIEKVNPIKTTNHTKVPIGFSKETKWDTYCIIIHKACAYVCTLHKIQIK